MIQLPTLGMGVRTILIQHGKHKVRMFDLVSKQA